MITLITFGLIIGTALLVKNAKTKSSKTNYTFVLLGGIITFLFEPTLVALYGSNFEGGVAVQIVSTIFGIYCIGWAIMKLIKFKRK